MQRGVATFTLDYGKCPKWLFERMVSLGREMTRVLVQEYGPDEFIKRIADPVWFQSLGTLLAFDWNASGLTTILTAALKEAIRGREKDLGIFICGGKGKTSKKTPDEISVWGERLALPTRHVKNLVYNSKMSAKVDSALVQDGFQIYHHAFFFSRPSRGRPSGAWAVVQQGMNPVKQKARRYHWYSNNIKDLIVEPHSGIVSDPLFGRPSVLNMTAKKADENRNLAVGMVQRNFAALMKDVILLRKHFTPFSRMARMKIHKDQLTLLELEDREFKTHPVTRENFSASRYLEKILWQLCDEKPDSYEKLVALRGVGPKTVRALALIGEVIYGAPPSYEDPARYSFAHGGKDATPYPVDKKTYDESIGFLQNIVRKMSIGPSEKNEMEKKLKPD